MATKRPTKAVSHSAQMMLEAARAETVLDTIAAMRAIGGTTFSDSLSEGMARHALAAALRIPFLSIEMLLSEQFTAADIKAWLAWGEQHGVDLFAQPGEG